MTAEKLALYVSLFISIGTVLTVTLPKLGFWLKEKLTRGESAEGQIKKIRALLEEHVAEDRKRSGEWELQKEVDRCVLRDLITSIYYQYAGEKKIPVYAFEDVMALNDLYHKRGGNSYVKNLIGQITEEWEIVSQKGEK